MVALSSSFALRMSETRKDTELVSFGAASYSQIPASSKHGTTAAGLQPLTFFCHLRKDFGGQCFPCLFNSSKTWVAGIGPSFYEMKAMKAPAPLPSLHGAWKLM